MCAGRLLSASAGTCQRRVAVTIDDLPAGDQSITDGAILTEVTTKLVRALRKQPFPAIGFLNEGKLYRLGEVDTRSTVPEFG